MADIDHDLSAQLEEQHTEFAESNLTDSHFEDGEQHEALVADDGAPSGDHVANDTHEDHITHSSTEAAPTLHQDEDATPAKDAPAASPSKAKAKSSISVKPTGPGGSAPSTPTVRKVLKSGTFGAAGAPKPTTSKPATTTSALATKPTTSAPSSLRKSVSAAPAPSKASMPPPSRQSTTGPSAPSRRASIVPKAPVPPVSTKSPLSSSTNSKPAGGTRGAVTSPDSAASLKSSTSARPRASVSEGVKRATPAPRASIVPSPGPNRPSSTASVRPGTRTATAGSITSIKEVRDDSKALGDLQYRLDEANASLATRDELVATLETQIAELKASLNAASVDIEAKTAFVDQLSKAKETVEAELVQLKQIADGLASEQNASHRLLHSVQEELHAAREATISQNELIQSLQSQIGILETEIAAAKKDLDVLRSHSEESTSAAAEAAAVEHVNLLKAHADLSAIKEETEQLRIAHASALLEAQTKIGELQSRVSQVDNLRSRFEALQAENDEKATKVSELEIEILELKEEQESSEDAQSKSLARINALEEDIVAVNNTLREAVEDAKIKDQDYIRAKDAVTRLHALELQKAGDVHAALTTKLETLAIELATALAAHQQTETDAESAAELHRSQVADLKTVHLAQQTELSDQLKDISAKLENESSRYNAMIDAVKAEHEVLLQEAFERAKSEAGALHSQDLQSLRAESRATMDQLRDAQISTIQSLKAEHEEVMRSRVASLEKQISNQQLELKATQDDLAKSKAAAASILVELEAAKIQLEEARSVIAALDKSDKDETIAQLSKDLSNSREEYAALTDAYSATQSSMREMAHNHSVELEEAAKGRAEEVTKLRSAHDEEIAALTNDRIALTTRLSDLEGDLATAKAAMTSDPLTSPRSNGAAHARTSSVSREELTRLHEAHNLKLGDLQAEHERVMRAMREELEIAHGKSDHLNQELNRKTMEIQYLEQDQEESQDQITRLKSDVDLLTEQVKDLQASR